MQFARFHLRGGGSEENLDRCARKFLDYMADIAHSH